MKNLRKILAQEGLIRTAKLYGSMTRTPLGADVTAPPKGAYYLNSRGAYATIKEGDEVLSARGRKNKGDSGIVSKIQPTPSQHYVIVALPGKSYDHTSYDGYQTNTYEDKVRLSWQNINVLKTVDGRQPLRVGERIEVIRASRRRGIKLPKGTRGTILQIALGHEGTYVLLEAESDGELYWARATTIKKA